MTKLSLVITVFASIIFFSFFFLNTSSLKQEEIPKVDVTIGRMLKRTVCELKKKYKLSIAGVGGSARDGKETTIEVSFGLDQVLTKEKCRELMVDSAEQLLIQINSDAVLKPHLIHFPFTCNDIVVRFFMRRPDRSDIPYPDISTMSLRNGVVYYDVDDPVIRYKYSSIEEPFEEAVRIVHGL